MMLFLTIVGWNAIVGLTKGLASNLGASSRDGDDVAAVELDDAPVCLYNQKAALVPCGVPA